MLYSGTMNNFLGSEPILMRTLGSQPVLKTDTFLPWLHGKNLATRCMVLNPSRVLATWRCESLPGAGD